MDLKKLFPLSYKKSLVVSLIIYIIAAIVLGAIIGLAGWMTGWIPVAGTVIGWYFAAFLSSQNYTCLAASSFLFCWH